MILQIRSEGFLNLLLIVVIFDNIMFLFRKDNGFNFKVINWNDENRNGCRAEVKKLNLNSPKILNDNKIDENEQNINKSIELLDNNHMPSIHSPLQTPTFKRNHEGMK